MHLPRLNKEMKLPEFWFWDDEGLSFSQDWLEDRPVSKSSLYLFRESPRHYSSRFIVGKKPPSDDMKFGNLVEALVFLSKKDFDKKYRLFEKATGTGSQAINKAAFAKAMKAKVELITKEDLERAGYCRESVMDNPDSRKLIENAFNYQKKLLWRNKKTNIPLVGYLDFESKAWETDFICDFKTTGNAEPEKWSKTAFNMENHLQAAIYSDAYKRLYFRFPYFLFLVVESTDPYNVTIQFVESKTMSRATDEFYGSLLAFRKCIEEKKFHQGYEFRLMGMNYFSLRYPGYYKTKFGGIK